MYDAQTERNIKTLAEEAGNQLSYLPKTIPGIEDLRTKILGLSHHYKKSPGEIPGMLEELIRETTDIPVEEEDLEWKTYALESLAELTSRLPSIPE